MHFLYVGASHVWFGGLARWPGRIGLVVLAGCASPGADDSLSADSSTAAEGQSGPGAPAAPREPAPPAPPAVDVPVALSTGLSGTSVDAFSWVPADIAPRWPGATPWVLPGADDGGDDGFVSNTPVALAPDVTLATLRALVASSPARARPVVFRTGTGCGAAPAALAAVVVHAADEAGPSPWTDPAASPPAEGDVVLAFDDATPMHVVGAAVARVPGRMLRLKLGPAPCMAAPDGMRCARGDDAHPTLYATTTTLSAAALAACARRGCAGRMPGTWGYAQRACRSVGMRLPTVAEARWLGLEGRAWSADWVLPTGTAPGRCHGLELCGSALQHRTIDGAPGNATRSWPGPPWCVADHPVLASTRPWTQWTTPPLPAPVPDPEGAARAAAIEHDPIEDKAVCSEEIRKTWSPNLQRGGRSSTTCRDPFSYVLSNEPWRWAVGSSIRNLGGAYFGVGSDQAYDFISAQRARWAWTGDYDPNVFRLHRLVRAFVLSAPDRNAFVAWYASTALPEVKKVLAEEYSKEESNALFGFYLAHRSRLEAGYRRALLPREDPLFGWLASDDNYGYIRTLFEQGRIVAIKADLMGPRAIRSVGDAARVLGVPLRLVYVSNAPTAWGGQVIPAYATNIGSLPYDEFSVFFTTENGGGKISEKSYWVYQLASAREAARRLAGSRTSFRLLWDSERTQHDNVRALGLPATRPSTEGRLVPTRSADACALATSMSSAPPAPPASLAPPAPPAPPAPSAPVPTRAPR